MKEREGIIDFLNKVEKQYPVHTWECENIQFWPLLKMHLFFTLQQEMQKKASAFQFYKKKLINKAKAIISNKNHNQSHTINDLKKIDLLFSSAHTARSYYNEISYSKLFDNIMDNTSDTSILMEYLNFGHLKNIYRSERVFNYNDFKIENKNNTLNFEISEYIELEELIAEYNEEFLIDKSTIERKLFNSLKNILWHIEKWKAILKITNPKVVMLLCYYNDPMFGLVHACNSLNIPVVDMQHGGQGAFHPMYFFNDPAITKLNLIPSHFWLWDQHYHKQICNWLPTDEQYRAILGGNPWIDFMKKEAKQAQLLNKKIVYTLQIGIEPYFPPLIQDAIQHTPDGYEWHIRLHPRMSSEEIDKIQSAIKKMKSKHICDLQASNEIPLPIMMEQATVHISRFSGSIAEADMQDVSYNIIIDVIGKNNFPEIVAAKRAHYLDPESNQFFQQLERISPNKRINNIDYSTQYQSIINNIK